jgi:hypothetical protein
VSTGTVGVGSAATAPGDTYGGALYSRVHPASWVTAPLLD